MQAECTRCKKRQIIVATQQYANGLYALYCDACDIQLTAEEN